jgi:hypothetical protein
VRSQLNIEIKQTDVDIDGIFEEWVSYKGHITGNVMINQHGEKRVEVEIETYQHYGFLWLKKKLIKKKMFIDNKNLKIWSS